MQETHPLSFSLLAVNPLPITTSPRPPSIPPPPSTHSALPAASYDVPSKVLALAMSGAAASHTLVAVGGAQPGVSLLDPLSGANTHTLTGHK
jgi:hypothetical protein